MHHRPKDRHEREAVSRLAPSWRAIANANAEHLCPSVSHDEDRLGGFEHQKLGLLPRSHSVAVPNAVSEVIAHCCLASFICSP